MKKNYNNKDYFKKYTINKSYYVTYLISFVIFSHFY